MLPMQGFKDCLGAARAGNKNNIPHGKFLLEAIFPKWIEQTKKFSSFD